MCRYCQSKMLGGIEPKGCGWTLSLANEKTEPTESGLTPCYTVCSAAKRNTCLDGEVYLFSALSPFLPPRIEGKLQYKRHKLENLSCCYRCQTFIDAIYCQVAILAGAERNQPRVKQTIIIYISTSKHNYRDVFKSSLPYYMLSMLVCIFAEPELLYDYDD